MSDFVDELEAFKNGLLAPIVAAGATSLDGTTPLEPRALLQVALANEIAGSELAAAWMPTTGRSRKSSPRIPRAMRSAGSLKVGTMTAALEM